MTGIVSDVYLDAYVGIARMNLSYTSYRNMRTRMFRKKTIVFMKGKYCF